MKGMWIGMALLASLAFNEEKVEPYEIVVTAGRDLEEVSTATVSVIKKDAFEGRNMTLSEVINQESGVKVQRMGGLGEYSSVSIRGAASEQVKVYMDGVPVNSASGGGVDISKIPLTEVERIEIYKGTIPAEFQGNGTGGVVNIITNRAGKGFVSAQATAGSFSTEKVGAMASGSLGSWAFMGSGDYQNSANDYEWLDDRGTRYGHLIDPAGDDTIRKMENNDFTSYAGVLKAEYGQDGPWRFSMSANGQISDKGWFYTKAAPPYRTRVETWDYALQGHAEYRASLFTAEGKGTFRIASRHFIDPDGMIFYLSQDITDQTREATGIAALRYHPSKLSVTSLMVQGGLETLLEENHLEEITPSRPDVQRYTALFTLAENADLLKGRISLSGAYTLDYRDTRSDFGGRPSLWRKLQNSYLNDIYHNTNVGALFAFNGDHRLKINSGYYTRVPNFYELFGNNGYSIGNDSLLPEKGINNDITLQDRIKLPMEATLSSAISGFVNFLKDQIVYVNYNNHVIKPENMGDIWIAGVEHDAELSRTPFTFRNQFTFMRSRIYDIRFQPDVYLGKERAYLPAVKNTFSVLAGILQNGEICYDLNYRSEYFKSEYNSVVLPKIYSHDLTLRWMFFKKSIKITGEIKNLTNNKNYDVEAFPLPGRAYYLTLFCLLNLKERKNE